MGTAQAATKQREAEARRRQPTVGAQNDNLRKKDSTLRILRLTAAAGLNINPLLR